MLPCAQHEGTTGVVLGDGSTLVNPAVKRVVADPAIVDPALHAKVRSRAADCFVRTRPCGVCKCW